MSRRRSLFGGAFVFLIAVSLGHSFLQAEEQDPYPTGPEAGRKLAAELRAIRPDENASSQGVLRMFGRSPKVPPVPIHSQITVGETNWTVTYVTAPTDTNVAEKFEVIFSTNGPNRYFYARAEAPGQAPGETKQLTGAAANIPIGGSDFWLSDMGLDFLQWPNQFRLKGEMRNTRPCYVLVSTNPHPEAGGYSVVKTWIEKESGQPLDAEAYRANDTNSLMKTFSLTKVERDKDTGRYQVKEMVIKQKKLWTRLEMDTDNAKH